MLVDYSKPKIKRDAKYVNAKIDFDLPIFVEAMQQ